MAKKNTPPLLRDVPHIELLPENNVKTNFFEDILFEEHNKALPDYLTGFALFGKLTGWRENEVAGLTWDRVDLDRRTVRLNPEHTKNKQIRNMYMEDELVVLMIEQEQMKRKGCPYVFHCNGKRLSVGGVKGCKDIRFDWNRSFRESSAGYGYCTSPTYRGKWEAEGLTAGPTFHDLRRTAAREMDDASLSRKQIRLRGGWKTDSMFDRYNIGTEKDTERAADKLSKHRNGAGDYNPDYNLPPESENYTLVVPQDP